MSFAISGTLSTDSLDFRTKIEDLAELGNHGAVQLVSNVRQQFVGLMDDLCGDGYARVPETFSRQLTEAAKLAL